MIYLIFKLAVLAALLLAGSFASQMVGGFLYMLISLTIRIPGIGPYMQKLLDGNVKITTAVKLISWGIGIGGMYWGIWLYNLIWSAPFSNYEHWVILILAGIVIINTLNDVLTLKVYDPKDGLEAATSFLPADEVEIIKNNWDIRQKLIFSNLIDMYIPLLIKQLTSMGVFYLSFYHLGFCKLKTAFTVPPTHWECIKYAYSYLPIIKVDNSEVAFEGFYWDICTIVFGVIVFIWTTALLNYVLSTFMEQAKPKDETEVKVDMLNTRLEATFQHFYLLYEELKGKVDNLPKPRNKAKTKKDKTDNQP